MCTTSKSSWNHCLIVLALWLRIALGTYESCYSSLQATCCLNIISLSSAAIPKEAGPWVQKKVGRDNIKELSCCPESRQRVADRRRFFVQCWLWIRKASLTNSFLRAILKYLLNVAKSCSTLWPTIDPTTNATRASLTPNMSKGQGSTKPTSSWQKLVTVET